MSRAPLTVEVTTGVHAPRDVVFDLELDVEVHAASLPDSAESATTSTGRHRIGLGDQVTFNARHFGAWWRMTAVVTELDRPSRFVDEQVRGPFAVMRHEHVFLADGAEATVRVDRMSVRAPGGPLGVVIEALLLGPYLRRLLTVRAAHIKAVAETCASP